MATNPFNGFYEMSPEYPRGFNSSLSFVTPFTHRTNISYAELLFELYKWLREKHLPELDKILKEWQEQYKIDLENVKQDIENTKNDWQALFDQFMADVVAQLEALNDQAVANLIANEESETYQSANSKFVAHNELCINIMDRGAVRDGVTDDTVALQSSIDIASLLGVPTVYLPPGDYHIDGYAVLKDNIEFIGYGARLIKLPTSTRQSSFVSMSNGLNGYGSGCKNVGFNGVTLVGSFAGNRGNALTLHHADEVRFTDVVFEQCIITGHATDLGGCSNIKFDNCTFAGYKPSSGREYTEAIQLDYSTAVTLGLDTIASSFDGLPTINVEVVRCKFIPLVVDGVTYPAPNPIGNHARVFGKFVDNVKFHHNVVRGGNTTVGYQGSTSTFHKGWIALGYAKNISIDDNIFINETTSPVRVLNINAPVSAYNTASVADPNAVMEPVTAVPCRNVSFQRNRLIGFKSNASNSRDEALIYIRGGDAGNMAKNISLNGTIFENCSPALEDTYEYYGQIGINSAYVDGLSARDLKIDGLSQLLLSQFDGLVTIGGSGYLTSILAQTETTERLEFIDFTVKYPGGARIRKAKNLTMRNVELETVAVTDGGSLGLTLFDVSNSTNILTNSVRVNNSSGSTAYTRGLWIREQCSVGSMTQNIAYGEFPVAGFRVEADSSTVVLELPLVAV